METCGVEENFEDAAKVFNRQVPNVWSQQPLGTYTLKVLKARSVLLHLEATAATSILGTSFRKA